MDEFIARANIQHFEELLATETDAEKYQVLKRLLADEKLKLLSAALRRRNEGKPAS